MGRYLHFGCDQNLLDSPWENFDMDVDIRKPLPFQIGSASLVLAEHVIEHVSFRDGLRFLSECLRILEPGGVLRLAFPDILRDIPLEDYRAQHSKFYNTQINCSEDLWYSMLTDWGHESCWTEAMACRVLMAAGFDDVRVKETGSSGYPGLYGNVDLIPRAETCALEAIR